MPPSPLNGQAHSPRLRDSQGRAKLFSASGAGAVVFAFRTNTGLNGLITTGLITTGLIVTGFATLSGDIPRRWARPMTLFRVLAFSIRAAIFLNESPTAHPFFKISSSSFVQDLFNCKFPLNAFATLHSDKFLPQS